MSNQIKHNPTGSEADSVFKGDWAIRTHAGGGPTGSTGFYNGIDIPVGGYAIYTPGPNGPSIRTASNDAELINILNTLGIPGGDVQTVLRNAAGTNSIYVTNLKIADKVTEGLIVDLESNNVASYPKGGSVWYDMSGNGNHFNLSSHQFSDGYLENLNDTSNHFIATRGDSPTLNSTFSTTNGAWTIEELIWTNSTDYPEADAGSVASGTAYSGDAVGFDWNHGQGTLNSLQIGLGGNNGVSGYDDRVYIAIDPPHNQKNRWRTRTIIFNRGQNRIELYMDGYYMGSAETPNSAGYSVYDGGGITFGSLYGWKHFGRRGSIKIWNRQLTTEEVKRSHLASISTLNSLGSATRECVLHWDAEVDQSLGLNASNVTTNVFDLSGNGNNADIIGGSIVVERIDGVKAWKFDTIGKLFESQGVPNGFDNTSRLTFEATIRAGASEVSVGDRGTIIVGGAYMSWNKSDQRLSSYWYSTNNRGYHEAGDPLERERWYHWVSVWTGTQLIQYIDGVEINRVNTTTTVLPSSLSRIRVGAESDARQFSGHINRIRVWNGALRPEEVAEAARQFKNKTT